MLPTTLYLRSTDPDLVTAWKEVFSMGERRIDSLLVCGLCTGVGAMPVRRRAAQMRVAYRSLSSRAHIPSFETIYDVHKRLHTAG